MDDLHPLALAPQADRSGTALVLQRLPLDRAVALRALYLRLGEDGGCRQRDGRLVLARGATISFDTYFGAFFEQAWRAPTVLRGVVLDLDIAGSFTLRVLRRTADAEEVLLHEEERRGWSGRLSIPLPAPAIPAAGGRLFAEVKARRGCTIAALEWRTPDTPVSACGLVPVFCTFGRERQLAEVLGTLAAEPDCWQGLPAIVVVNQGRKGLADHPAIGILPPGFAARLRIVEQDNLGGAGGFTRGLLEAREIPGATHALLMDDDVAAEPEALRRAAAFFAIARPRQVLGGHMLDMLRPTRLYEAGAQVDLGRLSLRPLQPGLPLAEQDSLDALTRPEPMHYNGWWFFGLPLDLLEEAGLPLPCFIRGDDVEYGLRLHGLGASIVTLPGAAIWHEPFYVKLNGWQLYYETRNMLVAAATHMPKPRRRLAVLLTKWLLSFLLTYRYYSAALLLRGIEDYLRGPAILEGHPGPLHAALEADRAAFPPEVLPAGRCADAARFGEPPRSSAGAVLRLAGALLRNATAPSPPGAPARIDAADFTWFNLTRLDDVAVETGWDASPPVFRRSRPAFLALARRGAALLRRVARDGDAVAAEWRASHARFGSTAFWEGYLARDPAQRSRGDSA